MFSVSTAPASRQSTSSLPIGAQNGGFEFLIRFGKAEAPRQRFSNLGKGFGRGVGDSARAFPALADQKPIISGDAGLTVPYLTAATELR